MIKKYSPPGADTRGRGDSEEDLSPLQKEKHL